MADDEGPAPPRLRWTWPGDGATAPLSRDEVLPRDEVRDRLGVALDLSGVDAAGAYVERCRFDACQLDDLELHGASLDEFRLDGCTAASLGAGDGVWRDVELVGCRVGVLSLDGAHLDRVVFDGGKVDLLNLRGATVRDVVLRDVHVGELDLGLATLRSVALEGCTVGSLVLDGTGYRDVDLRRSAIVEVSGVRSLAGTVITPTQLVELAPQLAAELGVAVLGLAD